MPIAILSCLMFVAAMIFSMLGQGGGVLYTPLQVWAGIRFHTAATTSLFLIMIMSFSSSLVFRKAKRIDWPMAIALESATTCGAFFGGLGSAALSESVLAAIFSAVVLVAGLLMLHRAAPTHFALLKKPTFVMWKRTMGDHTYSVNMAVALPISFIAGLASGVAGIGGGIIKVPMMVLLLGIPLEIAVGSSAFMVGLTATAGLAGHAIHGHFDWRTSLVLAVAVFLGAQVGSRISVGTTSERLRRGYGIFLLLVAGLMLFQVW